MAKIKTENIVRRTPKQTIIPCKSFIASAIDDFGKRNVVEVEFDEWQFLPKGE